MRPQPYGLYHQLLCAWLGVAPEESEEVAQAALVRAVKATFARRLDEDQVNLLSQVMGLRPVLRGPALSRFGSRTTPAGLLRSDPQALCRPHGSRPDAARPRGPSLSGARRRSG